MESSVANYIATTLKQAGVEYFFVLTGGDQALWIALEDVGIEPVLARSEASAVYMADGYARRSGKVGLVYGQSGPGTANCAAALADPYWNGSPVLLITSCPATGTEYRNDYQELATDGMLQPVTTADFRLPDPSRIVDLLPRALSLTRSQGPVSISIPRNQFTSIVRHGSEVRTLAVTDDAVCRPHPQPDALAEVKSALDEAQRPILLIGSGARRAGIPDGLSQLANDVKLPVVGTVGGKSAFPEDDPLWVGVGGRYAARVANEVAKEADLVLALGSRLGGLATDGYKLFATDATVVQVSTNVGHLGIGYPADLRICSDVGAFVEALLRDKPSAVHTEWADAVEDRVRAWRGAVAATPEVGSASGALKPYKIFDVLNRHADDINVVADTGYMAAWSSVLYSSGANTDTYFRANGSLGWAYAASLGVQMADTSRRTICVIGDGGVGYHVGDFETQVRLGVPTITLVLNNGGLAFEYHAQLLKWDGRVIPKVNDFVDTNYSAIANAFGIGGQRVRTLTEFEKAFADALASDGPHVIDVVIDKEEFAPITNFDAIVDRRV